MIPALALFLSAAAQADDSPLWMRYCAISPDGQTIAFSYQGDIYTVPSSGGKARQLTTHPAHDTRPVWSPDAGCCSCSARSPVPTRCLRPRGSRCDPSRTPTPQRSSPSTPPPSRTTPSRGRSRRPTWPRGSRRRGGTRRV